ncbi:MAG: HAD family hydrolase [Oleibacter sp.]|nr:HAD family hydrolase [Thalassolituus sp.]
MTIKLITLDLDDTLWNTRPALIAAETSMYQWIEENSPTTAAFYPPGKMREYMGQIALAYPQFAQKVTQLRQETLWRIFMQAGHQRDEAKALGKQAFDVFYRERNRLTLFEDVAENLAHIAERFTVIAVTNGNADLRQVGIDHWFAHSLTADDGYAAKPNIEMFEKALSLASCTSEQSLHIGDHPQMDIHAAQQAGFHTLWFNPNQTVWSEQDIQPSAMFTHWSQLQECLKKFH